MKRMYVILLFFLLMNLTSYVCRRIYVLTNSPLADKEPVIEPAEVKEAFNATETVSQWSTFVGMLTYIGDVVGGLFNLLGEIGVFIVAFPYFLHVIGTPLVWEVVLDAVWCFVIGWGIIEWISGREAQK